MNYIGCFSFRVRTESGKPVKPVKWVILRKSNGKPGKKNVRKFK